MRRLLLICTMVLAGCASSKVTTSSSAGVQIHEVNTIALAPNGGLLADAVGVELFNKGFTVIDAQQTSQLLVRLNLSEIDVSQPQNLRKLKTQGIDSYLSVRAAGGYDQQPQSASARMMSTDTGKLIAGASWQNGWGGMAGSISDRIMRKGLADAAREIADALLDKISQQR